MVSLRAVANLAKNLKQLEVRHVVYADVLLED